MPPKLNRIFPWNQKATLVEVLFIGSVFLAKCIPMIVSFGKKGPPKLSGVMAPLFLNKKTLKCQVFGLRPPPISWRQNIFEVVSVLPNAKPALARWWIGSWQKFVVGVWKVTILHRRSMPIILPKI